MAEGKTSISNAGTLREIGEYWDTHDLAEHWDETHEVHFDVELEPSVTYFALDKNLAERLREAAKQPRPPLPGGPPGNSLRLRHG